MTMDNAFAVDEKEESNKRVRMKKQLGLLEGVAIIIGIIFGSGIWYISVLTCVLFLSERPVSA